MNKYDIHYIDHAGVEFTRGIIAASKHEALSILYDTGFFDAPRLKSLWVEDCGPLSPAEEAAYHDQTGGKNLPLFTAVLIDKEDRLRFIPVRAKNVKEAEEYVKGFKWMRELIYVTPKLTEE